MKFLYLLPANPRKPRKDMIKKYLGKSFLTFVMIASAAGTKAQTSSAPLCVELNTGFREYLGDLGSSLFFQRKPIYNGGGVNFGYYINPYLDAVLNASFGDVGFYSVVEPRPEPWKYAGFRANTLDATVGLRLKFLGLITGEDTKISPYIHAAWGGYYVHTAIKNRTSNITDMGANLQGGVGISFYLNDKIGVRWSFTGNYTMNDRWDGENGQQNNTLVHQLYRTNDFYAYNALGITISLGEGSGPKKCKDKDEDGVCDKYDLCKNTPEKYRNFVDSVGCPADRDKDSILDADDACPDVWGLRKFAGCPDSDGDGIEDKMDKCPKVAGLAAFQGCPDSDGDGVQDTEDECPKVAGLKEFKGCPDGDGDGIEDRKDKCPTKAGTPEGEGCPDSDGDGIFDHLDKCPLVAGVAANKGCPEIKKEVAQKIALAAKGINFETNKDVILASSFKDLDSLTSILNRFPEAQVEIQGHTDNAGDRDPVKRKAKNQDLSQRRANAVKAYLESHGVAGDRLTAVGYGEEKPIADNATPAGKAKNRRVDFKLSY